MKELMDYLPKEVELNPKFRTKQVFDWVYQKYVDSFDEMKNIPKDLRESLKSEYNLSPLTLVKSELATDGTEKFLFRLHDGHTVETVLILMKEGEIDDDGEVLSEPKYTVCISSQVGCKVGCSFCLTAKGGFIRNLSTAEIVAQVWMMKKIKNLAKNRAMNIVYMGMGEPLDNFSHIVKAIEIIKHEQCLTISGKRQTLSTSGISSKIEKLGKEDLGINLAISLHAVDDSLREELIPMNKAYNIESIITAVKNFPVNRRKRVMFEYLVINNINDDLSSAKKLIKLLNGIKAKVNLIYFNPYPGTPYERPTPKKMEQFQKYLLDRGLLCTIRESKGIDISAACGQLREKEIKE